MAGPSQSPMLFPETPRVLYAKKPLIEVICQLRYPPILRIDSELPARFQERVRNFFPLLTEQVGFPLDFAPDISRFIEARVPVPQTARREWKFTSADTKWSLALTRDFVALSTQEYSRWEDFRGKLQILLQALQDEYHPSFFTRLGLRYQDLIVRSALGLTDVPWSELLQQHVAAEFSSQIAGAIDEVSHQMLVSLPGGEGKFTLRHGTARKPGEGETFYLVDSDFFSDERTEMDHALDRLDNFNRLAGQLFRWTISDRLHRAMEPTALA